MKVLVIGGGGREHAIVDALARSAQVEKIFCAPGNAGIARQAECVAIRETEVERLRDFADALEHLVRQDILDTLFEYGQLGNARIERAENLEARPRNRRDELVRRENIQNPQDSPRQQGRPRLIHFERMFQSDA